VQGIANITPPRELLQILQGISPAASKMILASRVTRCLGSFLSKAHPRRAGLTLKRTLGRCDEESVMLLVAVVGQPHCVRGSAIADSANFEHVTRSGVVRWLNAWRGQAAVATPFASERFDQNRARSLVGRLRPTGQEALHLGAAFGFDMGDRGNVGIIRRLRQYHRSLSLRPAARTTCSIHEPKY